MDIKDITTLFDLARQPWMIDKVFLDRIVPALARQVTHGSLSIQSMRADNRRKIDERYAGVKVEFIGEYVYGTRKVKSKSGHAVAIMPVIGTLIKRGDMCSYGMRAYINEIAALNENDEISAIVMDMESPGGTVDGTNEFGMAVKNSKKPIVTFGDAMVASAAYWVASQSRHIVGNKNNPTEFGSIGVLYVHENWSKFIEEQIGSVEIMRAKQSTDKARVNVIEELVDPYRTEVQQDLNEIADQFIKTVKKGRGSKLNTSLEGLFTGRMFKAQEALKHGMIDSIGNIWDAVNIAADLATGNQSSTSSKQANMSLKKAVSSFFKPKATKKAAEEPSAAEDDATPMWTEDMIFNTDGSGDGAFCLHPDTEGNDRKFETKIDNNQGNEPPTDPGISEDDNWSVVAEEQPAEDGNADEGGDNAEGKKDEATTVTKLNASIKKKNAEIKSLADKNKSLSDDIAKKDAEIKKLKADLEAAPAGKATTVVAEEDHDPDKKKDKSKYRTSVDDDVDKINSMKSKSK